MKKLLACLILPFAFDAFGQAGSEIFLFDLHIRKDNVSIDNPKNITNHKGYDNQPFFLTDKLENRMISSFSYQITITAIEILAKVACLHQPKPTSSTMNF